MPLLRSGSFARRFRSLSAAERRAFLAALWTARGFDARVDGDVVIAERAGEAVRIDVVGLWGTANPDADLLVGTRSLDRVRSAVAGASADFLAPEELHELLCYGVDRGVADELARSHLQTGIYVEPTPSKRDRLPALSALSTPIALGALIVALLIVVGASGVDPSIGDGVPFGDGEQSGDGDPFDDAAADPGAVTTTSTPESGAEGASSSEDEYPDGLSSDGVENASTLVAGHWREVEGASRRLSITYTGPSNTTVFSNTVRHESEGQFYGRDRYLVESVDHVVVEDRVVRTERGSFADGAFLYRRIEDDSGVRYSETPLSERTVWTSLERFAVDRFAEAMRANETNVERIDRAGEPHYRVEAKGTPPKMGDPATEFAATAYLTADGRLVRLTVGYVHEPTGERVRFTVGYSDVDGVVLPLEPDWYEDAVRETS